MIGSDINKRFELYTDDQTELSSDEELFLGNEKCREIYSQNEWEFLRKTASGSFTGGYIDLTAQATDFANFMANYVEDPSGGSMPDKKVVFINGNPYDVIPMGSRYNQSGVAYLDRVNKRIVIQGDQSGTFSFDYKHMPSDYTLLTSPIIPDDFDMLVVYMMICDDAIIQMSDKARSYYKENMDKAASKMSDLRSFDAKSMLL